MGVGYLLNPTQETDLAMNWGRPNVIRYMLIYYGPGWHTLHSGEASNNEGDVAPSVRAAYLAWMNDEITNPHSGLHSFIDYCSKHGIRVLIDMHDPPGGVTVKNEERIFAFEQDYQDFLKVWASMAKEFAGNPTVWGYDVCNEPIDFPDGTDTPVRTWNDVVLPAAKLIRKYDNSNNSSNPQHAIVVESVGGNNQYFTPAAGREYLTPITTVKGIVYSPHMYDPYDYSYQGLVNSNQGIHNWPYTGADGTTYNKAWLAYHLQFVRQYQLANHAAMFLGEFSATRVDLGATAYLNDLISLFESYGWDWTYFCFASSTGAIGAATGYTDVWEPEMGPDPNSGKLYSTGRTHSITDRQKLLTNWFTNNASPLSDFTFESPMLGAKSYKYANKHNFTPVSWTYSPRSGLARNGSALGNIDAPTGAQVAFLHNASSLSQWLSWRPNITYTVSFEAAPRAHGGPQTIKVSVGGKPVQISVGDAFQNAANIAQSQIGWTTYTTAPFTVGVGTSPVSKPLTIAGTAAKGDNTAFLDDVIATGTPVEVRNAHFEFTSPTLAARSWTNIDPSRKPAGNCDFTEWVFTPGGGISTNGTKWTNNTNLAPAGTQVAFLTGKSSMTNSPIGTWDPNAKYIIKFSASPWRNNALYNLGIQTINVLVDSHQLFSVTPVGSGASLKDYRTPPFSVAAGAHTITFVGTSTTGAAVIVDNVEVRVSTPFVAASPIR
jgi:hypothetical protein